MIHVKDRVTGAIEEEAVYGKKAIDLLYGDSCWSRIFGPFFIAAAAKLPFVSAYYGKLQKRPSSRKKIAPFIESFGVDRSEFLNEIDEFSSFNDFFIRKLKPSARPIDEADFAVCPADGRYLFFPDIDKTDGFWVKGEKFALSSLLEDPELAEEYEGGSLVIARLCPTDYHRFHFPVECVPGPSRLINGWLYSVNPKALKRDKDIFTKNKRRLTKLESPHFGTVLFMEIGATNVGSIVETYIPGASYRPGDEKGYFEFGGSALAILFKRDKIVFAPDLKNEKGIEIKCLMGQTLGKPSYIR